jgi:hypothetical protein
MVIFLFLLLFPAPTKAVWQDDLFGTPAPAYFAKAHAQVQHWIIQRYGGNDRLKPGAEDFLNACIRSLSGWYHAENPELRLSSYAVRLSFSPALKKKVLSLRCYPGAWNPELVSLRERLLPNSLKKEKIIGLEFSLNSKAWAALLFDREIRFEENGKKSELFLTKFQDALSPESAQFPLPQLVQSWAKIGDQYRFELRAYADGIAPKELREDVEAFHREFGLLADSIHWSKENGAEIFFP